MTKQEKKEIVTDFFGKRKHTQKQKDCAFQSIDIDECRVDYDLYELLLKESGDFGLIKEMHYSTPMNDIW